MTHLAEAVLGIWWFGPLCVLLGFIVLFWAIWPYIQGNDP